MLLHSGTKFNSFLCLLDTAQANEHRPGSSVLKLLQTRRDGAIAVHVSTKPRSSNVGRDRLSSRFLDSAFLKRLSRPAGRQFLRVWTLKNNVACFTSYTPSCDIFTQIRYV